MMTFISHVHLKILIDSLPSPYNRLIEHCDWRKHRHGESMADLNQVQQKLVADLEMEMMADVYNR